MASPIEATPAVSGEDADRLLDDLARHCSDEEYARRVVEARECLAATLHESGDALTRSK